MSLPRVVGRRIAISMILIVGFATLQASAHCDALDGPVVEDARVALDRGDVTGVLKWVEREQEREIRDAFQQALAVRTAGDKAKALADRYFFETLVRVHRAGEGEGFTGLKPAQSVDAGIRDADEALRSGSATALASRLSDEIREGIEQRFAKVRERSKLAESSVPSGRQYVEAYVDYIHYVEAAHRLVSSGVPHSHNEPPLDPHP